MTDPAAVARLREALADETVILPAAWLYDDAGSHLFEQITILPEYYPTRVELRLLQAHAQRMAAVSGAASISELGCGASPKTHALIEGFVQEGRLRTFVAVDVNADAADRTVQALHIAHPGVSFRAHVNDFMSAIDPLDVEGTALLAFLGSTIGNLTPGQRRNFLNNVASALRPGDWLLLGIDLVKDPARILAAYDDSQGITAQFITNVIPTINALTGAALDAAAFTYEPSWNSAQSRIEMRLRATTETRAIIDGTEIPIRSGQSLFVEISTKFHVDRMRAELGEAGLTVLEAWSGADDGQQQPDFALLLAQRSSDDSVTRAVTPSDN